MIVVRTLNHVFGIAAAAPSQSPPKAKGEE
jgi:hypothetical protein